MCSFVYVYSTCKYIINIWNLYCMWRPPDKALQKYTKNKILSGLSLDEISCDLKMDVPNIFWVKDDYYLNSGIPNIGIPNQFSIFYICIFVIHDIWYILLLFPSHCYCLIVDIIRNTINATFCHMTQEMMRWPSWLDGNIVSSNYHSYRHRCFHQLMVFNTIYWSVPWFNGFLSMLSSCRASI